MKEVHIKAKTLDEAITDACVELAVTSDALEYRVDVQGSAGFFGIGAKQYEITAWIKEVKEEKKTEEKVPSNETYQVLEEVKEEAEEKELPRETGKDEKKADKAFLRERRQKDKFAEKRDKISGEDVKASEKDVDGGENVNVKERQKGKKPLRNREERPDKFEKERPERTRRGNRPDRPEKPERERGEKPERPEKTDREYGERPQDQAKKERDKKPLVLLEDPVERGKTFLSSLFTAMEMKIDYSGSYDNEKRELTINLSGDDMGVLIGKRGQTLDALQYLTSQVVNKHQNGYIRVKIDTENYRERRKETLEQFAVNAASKVRKNKRPMVLEPMNAYERRIVHSALQGEQDITTRSEGEEPYRHIVICPVKKKKEETAE